MIVDLKRLKRFDKAKHEQLEGLLQWCQMMGLSGKDLVSLGGHIERSQARERAISNRRIVDGLGCEPVGKDRAIESRWKFKTNGVTWRVDVDYSNAKFTNYATKTSKTFHVAMHDEELGKMHWRKRLYYATMLDVVNGRIKLDF